MSNKRGCLYWLFCIVVGWIALLLTLFIIGLFATAVAVS